MILHWLEVLRRCRMPRGTRPPSTTGLSFDREHCSGDTAGRGQAVPYDRRAVELLQANFRSVLADRVLVPVPAGAGQARQDNFCLGMIALAGLPDTLQPRHAARLRQCEGKVRQAQTRLADKLGDIGSAGRKPCAGAPLDRLSLRQ